MRPKGTMRSAEIISRLRLHFPIRLKVPDVVTGKTLVLDKENLYQMMVIDAPSLAPDQQTVAAFYVELSRFHRACERAAAAAETDYASWKSTMRQECIQEALDAGDKKPTGPQQEAHYRTHSDYQRMAGGPTYWKAMADLLGDAKQALRIKADMLRSMTSNIAGWDSTLDAEEKQSEMSEERLEALAGEVMGQDQSWRKKIGSPPAPPIEDEEEEDDEEEDEPEEDEEEETSDDDDEEEELLDDDEEEDDEPPPPPKKRKPAKKATKKATTKKTTKKRSTKKKTAKRRSRKA